MNSRRVFLGLILSLIFIYLIFWKPRFGAFFQGDCSILNCLFGEPRLNFELVWHYLRKTSGFPLLLCFLLSPMHTLIRSHRWVLLLEPVKKLKFIDSFSLQMVGYFTNTVFPLRIGEVAKGILLGEKLEIPRSTALATVVFERLLDILCLLIVLAVVGLTYPFPPDFRKGAIILGIAAVSVCALIIIYSFSEDPTSGFTGKLLNLLPGLMRTKVATIIHQFVHGFSILKSSRHYFLISFESLSVWVIYCLQGYFVMIAFGFHRDVPRIAEAPFTVSWVLLAITASALSIPAAPAGIGTYHAAAIFSLTLFGASVDQGAGFALVIHALTMSFYLVIGFLCMWREGLKMGELKRFKQPGTLQE